MPIKAFENGLICLPINNFIETLLLVNFQVTEQKIEDYHFHQLYFKMSGDIQKINTLDQSDFKRIENKFYCNCHWSTIELIQE